VTPPAHQLTLQGSIGLIIGHYLHKFTKIDSLKVAIVHKCGDNRGRDTDSRESPKIVVQGENHGSHGDREFVIYIHPYLLVLQELCKLDF